MYDAFLWLFAIIMFIALPVLTILLIVRAIRRKPVKKIILSLMLCVVVSFVSIFGALFTVPEDMRTEMPSTTTEPASEAEITEATTEEITATEPTTEEATTVQHSSVMVEQFKSLGFTQGEAEEMQEIFTTVGITEINNIRAVGNNGIDNLQAFICDIFDYSKDKGGVSVHFTVDKRQLCFISLDGIPATNVDYAYINIFGNVKFKTSNGTRSVTLYDIWDESGEIIPNAVGYKAVFDYENKKITAY